MLDVTEIGVGVLCTCSGSNNVPGAAGATTFLPHPAAISSDSLTAEIEAQSMNHYGDRWGKVLNLSFLYSGRCSTRRRVVGYGSHGAPRSALPFPVVTFELKTVGPGVKLAVAIAPTSTIFRCTREKMR